MRSQFLSIVRGNKQQRIILQHTAVEIQFIYATGSYSVAWCGGIMSSHFLLQ